MEHQEHNHTAKIHKHGAAYGVHGHDHHKIMITDFKKSFLEIKMIK